MENAQEVIDDLKHIYLFEALSDEQLERIIKSTQQVKLPAKQVLFEAGQPAERFYLLRKGQVKLYCISADGGEKVMEIIRPPQTFAEAIMFMQRRAFPVSCEAIVDSELYSFDMKRFSELLRESNETCFHLMASMSRRLHARIDEINNLTLHNATYRLVVFLLEQLPEGALELSDIHLSTPKSVIASRLSIQPETFSRILTRLSKQGLIEIHGNDISLLDVDGLRALL